MNIDEEVLGILIDRGHPVVRMVAAKRFGSSDEVELPSGQILVGNEISQWVEFVTRKRLAIRD